jgi:hypothetical protein
MQRITPHADLLRPGVARDGDPIAGAYTLRRPVHGERDQPSARGARRLCVRAGGGCWAPSEVGPIAFRRIAV